MAQAAIDHARGPTDIAMIPNETRMGGIAAAMPDREAYRTAPPRSASEIPFAPPATIAEARGRIAVLDYDIADIVRQFRLRAAREGRLDPLWAARANRARALKELERERLSIWLEERRERPAAALLAVLAELGPLRFGERPWAELMAAARAKLLASTPRPAGAEARPASAVADHGQADER